MKLENYILIPVQIGLNFAEETALFEPMDGKLDTNNASSTHPGQVPEPKRLAVVRQQEKQKVQVDGRQPAAVADQCSGNGDVLYRYYMVR